MEIREKNFQRNQNLESFLKDINGDLGVAEKELLKKSYKKYPIILVMGALRSGTTLMTQWIANTKEFAYPTNVLSRFYEAPIIGAKIQRLLLDPIYSFRNEIIDFSQEINYSSQNGKTTGALAPNEFWYFWRRFLPYESLDMDYLPDEELRKIVDKETFTRELQGMCNVFEKPFAMKGLIANYNIPFLDEIFENVIFIWVKREPCTNIASILEARKRQLGDEKKWYSFRIPEMQDLLKYEEPAMQAAGQVYYINKRIEESLKNVSEERKMEVKYEDFCENPEKYYFELREKLLKQGYEISNAYCGEKKFFVTRGECSQKIRDSYQKFMEEV